MLAFGITVTRLRAPLAADPYSGEATARDWANAASASIMGCAINPGESSESRTVNREQITTSPTLYAPFGSDVLPSDRIVAEGVTWEVDGRGGQWRSPFTGTEFGAAFPMHLVEG